jgi:hypothetical protein
MPSDFLSFYSPKSEVPAVLSDFIVILSFRSGYLLCRWTEVPAVLFGRLLSSVQGTCYALDYCHSVRSEVPAGLSDYCQSVRSEVPVMIRLSDNCQTVRSVGTFHLPFQLPFLLPFHLHLPFRLPLPFPFLSLPQDMFENSLDDTICIRSSWAYTVH